MRGAEQLVEDGFAHIAAVGGLVVSLFVWRASLAARTFATARGLFDARRRGLYAGSLFGRETWVAVWQVILWPVVVTGCVGILVQMARFLEVATDLYVLAADADSSVLTSLAGKSRVLKDSVVATGFIVVPLLFSDWLAELIAVASTPRARAMNEPHLFSIPHDWRDAPLEMWHQRLTLAAGSDQSAGDEWATVWTAWADMVGVVRDGR
jgi:hypothetical protein